MNKILIVDQSMIASLFQTGEIQKELKVEVITAHSLEQTSALLKTTDFIHAAIVEPNLSDDPSGSVVDLLIEHHIPVIVYTAALDSNVMDRIIHKPIVDYVIKSSRNNFFLVIKLISQLLRHQKTEILVVDDSITSRMHISSALKNLNLTIREAHGGEDAIKKIKEHPEIKLLLTDYNMEGENGIDLTRKMREMYTNKELAIIGISSYGNAKLSTDFLKNGANDFINKPFQKEELISRVLHQLDMINYISTIKDSSEKDFMTAIYNRKYVYEVGRQLFENAKRGNITLTCAMIDIDHFKRVNDTHGHDVGDKVIIRLAQELSTTFRKSDIVGRLGGEEFCIILTDADPSCLEKIFEELRQKIEMLVIPCQDEHKTNFNISFTVSIGVTNTLAQSFEDMLKFADMKLYEAKNYGRNLVVI